MKKVIGSLLVLLLSGCRQDFNAVIQNARQAYADKHYVEVVDSLNLALRQSPPKDPELRSEAHELIGLSYYQLQKPTQSIDALKQAMRYSKKTYPSAYTLGLIYLSGRDYPSAQAAFEEALKKRRDDPQALLGLGDAYFLTGQLDEAAIRYRRVLDASPGVRFALKNLEIIAQKKAEAKRNRHHVIRGSLRRQP